MQSPSKTAGDQKNCIFPTELVVLQVPCCRTTHSRKYTVYSIGQVLARKNKVSQSFEHSLEKNTIHPEIPVDNLYSSWFETTLKYTSFDPR